MNIIELTDAMNGIGSIVVGLYAIHVTISIGLLGLVGTLRVQGWRIPWFAVILGSLGYGFFTVAQHYTFRFLNDKANALLDLYRATPDFAVMVAANAEAADFVATGYDTPFFNSVLIVGSTAVVAAVWILNLIRVSPRD